MPVTSENSSCRFEPEKPDDLSNREFSLRQVRNDCAWLGGLIVAAGVGISVLASGGSSGLFAPAWVVLGVGAVLVLIGLSFLLRGFGFARLAPVAGLVALSGLTVSGLGIGSAAGASCSADLGFLALNVSGWSCGLVFGAVGAAILTLAVATVFLVIFRTASAKIQRNPKGSPN
ncbi:MAG: hypothetical protein GXP01_02715 [Alphaproteobacteria bacterium]|nr:hypothetical protein [Alphaproteobacteria bacterium]